MKKVFATVLALAMMLSLAACGSSSTPAASSGTASSAAASAAGSADPAEADGSAAASASSATAAAEDTERTKLTVGFDAAFPPYGYLDETSNDYKGFDLDLAQAVCDYYGWELVKQPIDWDSKDMELETGSIDCIWNGFTITGREDAYTWSAPYIDNSQVIVVKSDSGIAKLADLSGKIVDVQADSSALAAMTSEDATEEGKAVAAAVGQLLQVADYNTAFMDLESGAVDAIAMDVGVAQYQIAQRGDGFTILSDEPISTEKYGVGFKLGNEALRDQVQSALDALQADGTLQTIIDDWSSRDDGAYSYLADSWCLGA